MKPIERYSTVPLFSGLESPEISRLLDATDALETTADETILTQGGVCPGLYLVAAGSYTVHKEGLAEPIARLHELAHFGEMSLVTNEPCSATVICSEAGRLRLLPWERFRALLDKRDPLAFTVVLNMSRVMARRLVRAEDRFQLWSDPDGLEEG